MFGATLGCTLVVALLSYGFPRDWAATGVGVAFLGATYLLVVRSGSAQEIAAHGLSLGGVLLPSPLDWRRILRDSARAAKNALLLAAVVFPVFWLGFLWWWEPSRPLHLIGYSRIGEELFAQIVGIALPEEAFYRGYVQTALTRHLDKRTRPPQVLAPSVLVTSAVFALGHLLTEPNPARLAVFFPALLFGWLRVKTGGIGASILFHALCNTFASLLGQSYGLWR